MKEFSGPEHTSITAKEQKFVFAITSATKGSGGIAELSRQVFKTLLGMHESLRFSLQLHVLEESAPPLKDPLFSGDNLKAIRWYGGDRLRFALGLLLARPDFLLLDHVGLARLSGLMPPIFSRPYALLIHGVEIWNSSRKDYYRSARRASFLIANSNYTAVRSRNHYPDLPRIRVCWPGKDRNHSGPDRKNSMNQQLGPHAMLIVGRLAADQKHKGHDEIIESLALVLKEIPTAQLVVAGIGDDLDRLKSKAASLNVTSSVIFTGWVDDSQLDDLYSRCALFVMPSDGDGFGLVFLEAMMNKMPCVGLKTGAAAEILEDEVSGVLVDREDRKVLAKQLVDLLLDEKRRKRIGDAGYDRYVSLFTGNHFSDRIKSILRSELAA